MIVSEQTQKAVTELISQCFKENRWADRAVSVLGVNFACNKTSELLHHHVAHLYPAISDNLGHQCLERYNISVVYGATPEGAENYSSVKEIIDGFKDKAIDFQSMLIAASKIAFSQNDIHVFVNIGNILKDFNIVVEQLILLSDKINMYGNDIMAFDHDIDGFWILGE